MTLSLSETGAVTEGEGKQKKTNLMNAQTKIKQQERSSVT